MAKKSSEPSTTTLSVDLVIDQKHMDAIAGSVPGEGSAGHKTAQVALGLLEQIAEGGMMLPPLIVAKMRESLGKDPELTDILDQFEKGVGRRGGQLSITISLDPVHEQTLREAAKFNNFATPELYMQNLWDTFWDNGWVHDTIPAPVCVRMTPQDFSDLQDLLGKGFSNGTELVAAIRDYANSGAGIFEGVK